MKSLGELVYLLRVELACLAGFDELGGVLEGGRLVEGIAESLANDCARCRVVAAVALVNVLEELPSIGWRHAPQLHSVRTSSE